MKIMMINGSPKIKNSNSNYFSDLIKKQLKNTEIIEYSLIKTDNYDQIISDILEIQAIVFAMPLYVDSMPSHVIRFLSYVEENYKSQLSKVKVYMISNCGFYEGKQNHISIKILKCWCKRMEFEWGQGIGIGSGEMMGSLKNMPITQGPNKSLGLAINELANNFLKSVSGDEIFTTPSYFPRVAFRLASNSFWIKGAKMNGLKKKDLNKCIIEI
jgi:multimeric flavodoxin WrbA